MTYANGDKKVLYFKIFDSEVMLQNIVDRAKKMAIKEKLEADGVGGLRVGNLMAACLDEFEENKDLPTSPTPTTGRGSRQEGGASHLPRRGRVDGTPM